MLNQFEEKKVPQLSNLTLIVKPYNIGCFRLNLHKESNNNNKPLLYLLYKMWSLTLAFKNLEFL